MKVSLRPPYYRGPIATQIWLDEQLLGATVSDDRSAGRGMGQTGQAHVFLRTTYRALKFHAKQKAIELKESHIREEVMSVMIHESLHAILAIHRKEQKEPVYQYQPEDVMFEEAVVRNVTNEVMAELRTDKSVIFGRHCRRHR
jgi:hypothetical protein